MYDFIPAEGIKKAVSTLAEVPANLGMSYPANTGWRYWALAKGGRMDVAIREFRTKWANLESVLKNNTLQEGWTVEADTNAEWSHCPIAPLYMLYMGILGLYPDKPGFEEMTIWPQPGTIGSLEVSAQTVKGPVYFKSVGEKGKRVLELKIPDNTTGKLKLDSREKPGLELIGSASPEYNLFKLVPGKTCKLKLKYT
jgi:hypothetical protein